MMMRVKLVIIRMSDGSTVSRLIRMRICSESESGAPLPDTSPSARVSAPAGTPVGEAGTGAGAAGTACASAG